MATKNSSAGDVLNVLHEGAWHTLIITVRPQDLAPEIVAKLTAKTVGQWLTVWQAYRRDIWQLGDKPSPEKALEIAQSGTEPYVTVFNKNFDGMTVTIHSHENGQTALDAVGAILYAKDTIRQNMPKLFQIEQVPAKDIDDVDSFLGNEPKAPTPPAETPKPILHQGKVYVRSAMEGSIAGLLKITKGQKGKETFENAILANQAYDYKAVQYKEKDLVAFPIVGAIRFKVFDNSKFFEIPVRDGQIRIYEREDTVYEGKTIPSEFKTLHQHLSLEGVELKHDAIVMPLIEKHFVVMQIGKTTDKGEQYKKYKGLYRLDVLS